MHETPQEGLPLQDSPENNINDPRETDKEKWEDYVRGDEGNLSLAEKDSMRTFLIEHGTENEIQIKMRSFASTPSAEFLAKEVRAKRPEINLVVPTEN